MAVRIVDPYIPGVSCIHRADARVKLLVAAAAMLVILIVPDAQWVCLAGLGILLAVVSVASGVPPKALAGRVTPVIGLVALAALGLLFEGSPARFVSVSTKALLCAWAALVLSATTPFHSLLAALRSFRLPSVLVSVAGLAHRLVFVALDEAARMMIAYRCRVPRAGPGRRARHIIRLSVALSARSVSRTERLERALLARGFDGALRGLPLPPLGRCDLATLAGSLAVLLLIGWAALR